jgi:citrate lyase subunit beta/citryl-CoA lyase
LRTADPPVRSYLYVPGSEPRKIEKALAGDADAVVLDLEDAVAPSHKKQARETVAEILESASAKPVFVRINRLDSGLGDADIEAVCHARLAGLRLPKTESAESVRYVAKRLEALECEAGIQCLIESALGLELSFEIARAHTKVVGVSLGEMDLRADLGVQADAGLLYARSRIVAAARAAKLSAPVQSVYADTRDLESLRRSSKEGKSLGFVGRSAIHPKQVPIINEVFTPTEEEIAAAAELLYRMEEATEAGKGAFLLKDGRFVDEAIARSARLTLALAESAERKESGGSA